MWRALIDEQGLSPRARGNLNLEVLLRQNFRSIPACAGEPITGGAAYRDPKVYPRVRGGTSYEAWTPRIHA